MKSLFIFGVWGDDYIAKFLSYCLKSTIEAIKNIDNPNNPTIWIYTNTKDFPKFGDLEVYRNIGNGIDIQLKVLPLINSKSKYVQLAKVHSEAIYVLDQFDCIFLGYADAIFSKNSYKFAIDKIRNGFDVVYALGVPVDENIFLHNTKSLGFESAAGISEGLMQQLVLKSLGRPIISTEVSNPSSIIRSVCSWKSNCGSILFRSHHLHPVAISTRRKDIALNIQHEACLDVEFNEKIGVLNPCVYVVKSGFEITVLSLQPDDASINYYDENLSLKMPHQYATFQKEQAGFFHRYLFQFPAIYFSENSKIDEILEIEQKSKLFVELVNLLFLANYEERHKCYDRSLRRSISGLLFKNNPRLKNFLLNCLLKFK